MKRVFVFILLQLAAVAVNSAVLRSPNADDKQYWHDYNVNYLQKLVGSQKLSRVPKNVILFVGDGMSLTTIAAGRILKGQLRGNSGEETELSFENFQHLALSKTYNTDSQVPDSAATATAMFSGAKTSVRTLGLSNPTRMAKESERLKTIIDWAQEKGKRTGLVTTTRITHATPAAAYAYSFNRDYECDTYVPSDVRATGFKDIARQLVENKPGRDLNVIFGGGRDFLGATDEHEQKPVNFGGGAELSCNRTDGVNLADKYLRQFGNDSLAKYVTNTGELSALDFEKVDRVLGLFANNHMEYESLRNRSASGQPSLTEMTAAAIRILNSKRNKKGFVLIVEGGKIDHAHHQNHARLALEELVELERAIQRAKDMTVAEETLIIVTADHAHSMHYNGYGKRGNDILGFGSGAGSSPYETLVYATGPGFNYHKGGEHFSQVQRNDPLYMHQSMVQMEDSVHGGEDVCVYSNGPGSSLLQRTFEQCYIAYAISFAACIGPVAHMNELCSPRNHQRK